MGQGQSSWAGYDQQLFKDTKQQTVAIPNSEEKGATAIRRHPSAKDGFLMYLKDNDDKKVDLNTGWQCVKLALKNYPKRPMMGYRPFTAPDKNVLKRGAYKWDTYATIGKQIYACGAGLRSLNLGDKTNIGIFSINRSEWVVSHLANWNCSYRTVALYDTLGAQAVQYIVWHAELTAIFVEKDKLPQLFKAITSCAADKTLNLKYIIQYDYQKRYNNTHEKLSDDDIKKAKELNIELIGLTNLMQRGDPTISVASSDNKDDKPADKPADNTPNDDNATKKDDDNTDKPVDDKPADNDADASAPADDKPADNDDPADKPADNDAVASAPAPTDDPADNADDKPPDYKPDDNADNADNVDDNTDKAVDDNVDDKPADKPADNDDNTTTADDDNTGTVATTTGDDNKDDKKYDNDDDNKEIAPSSDDIAYIMYTSGTTGDPKGVLLTHRCFACTVASTTRGLAAYGDAINASDVHVSYLPLAHSFESAIISCCVASGAKVAFWAGNIKTISRDWKEIRPTVMFGVPRIYNKTYDKVQLKVKGTGGLKEWMYNKALVSSSDAVRQGKRSSIYDNLVWKKVAEEIGYDRVRILASGAAPLPPHVAEFLRIICPQAVVVQGYGLTESCAVSFFTGFTDINLGHIGIPVDNIEYRLVDAPECDYYVADKPYARGEIQLRGPTIMNGYYKNDTATNKALNKDKWFSTGDIGRINPNGTLSIIDRRKNMFKTAMGEYIASEKVENGYTKAGCVNQIWIYGNSFKSFVIAVIVPDPLWLVPILISKGKWIDEKLTPATAPYCKKFKQIVNDNYDLCKQIMKDDIKICEKDSDLKKFEKFKDFHIECDVDNLLQGFNVDNGTLTPTFKKKRPQLKKKYIDIIKKLYTDNGEPPNDNENW